VNISQPKLRSEKFDNNNNNNKWNIKTKVISVIIRAIETTSKSI